MKWNWYSEHSFEIMFFLLDLHKKIHERFDTKENNIVNLLWTLVGEQVYVKFNAKNLPGMALCGYYPEKKAWYILLSDKLSYFFHRELKEKVNEMEIQGGDTNEFTKKHVASIIYPILLHEFFHVLFPGDPIILDNVREIKKLSTSGMKPVIVDEYDEIYADLFPLAIAFDKELSDIENFKKEVMSDHFDFAKFFKEKEEYLDSESICVFLMSCFPSNCHYLKYYVNDTEYKCTYIPLSYGEIWREALSTPQNFMKPGPGIQTAMYTVIDRYYKNGVREGNVLDSIKESNWHGQADTLICYARYFAYTQYVAHKPHYFICVGHKKL